MGVIIRGLCSPAWSSTVHFSLKEVTAPTVEPITLAQAKQHLRIAAADTSEDALITARIIAAREQVEHDTSRLVARATYDLGLDALPADGIIVPPVAPLSSVTSLTVYDVDDVGTVIDPAHFFVDADSVPPRVVLFADDESEWSPEAGVRDHRAFVLRFVGGPDEASPGVPKASPAWAVQAIYLLLAHWHDNREAVVVGTIAAPLPVGYQHIIDTHALVGLA